MTLSRSRFSFLKSSPNPPDNPQVAEAYEHLESGQQQEQVISELILAGMKPSEAEAILEEAIVFQRSVRKRRGQRTYVKGIAFTLIGILPFSQCGI